jgi:predicted CoA-binding protein
MFILNAIYRCKRSPYLLRRVCPSDIRKILELKNVAVVGMSNTEGNPAHFVPQYLLEHGYNVIPVNPTTTEVLGKKSYPSISEVPEQVDVVDIFRRSEDVPPVVDDALKKRGIKFIDALMNVEEKVKDFVEECASIILRTNAKLVGFTSTFHQNCASLSVAKVIKQNSNIPIIFGGANCEGQMGEALLYNLF